VTLDAGPAQGAAPAAGFGGMFAPPPQVRAPGPDVSTAPL
jgi:hypothetical protein